MKKTTENQKCHIIESFKIVKIVKNIESVKIAKTWNIVKGVNVV